MENENENFDPYTGHQEMQARMREMENAETSPKTDSKPLSIGKLLLYILLLLFGLSQWHIFSYLTRQIIHKDIESAD